VARAVDLCKSAVAAGRRALHDLRTAPLSAADLVKSFCPKKNHWRPTWPEMLATKIAFMARVASGPLKALAGNEVLKSWPPGNHKICASARNARNLHVLLIIATNNPGPS